MSRPPWFWICILLAPVTLVGGWLVPMHLRAVEASVLQRAGRNTPGVASLGVALARLYSLLSQLPFRLP